MKLWAVSAELEAWLDERRDPNWKDETPYRIPSIGGIRLKLTDKQRITLEADWAFYCRLLSK